MIHVYHLCLDPNATSRLLAQNKYSRAQSTFYFTDPIDVAGLYVGLRNGPVKGLALLEVATVDSKRLGDAFDLTNSMDCNWFSAGHESVVATPAAKRSTLVGDLMVMDGTAYMVAPCGYVAFPWPTEVATDCDTDSDASALMRQARQAQVRERA